MIPCRLSIHVSGNFTVIEERPEEFRPFSFESPTEFFALATMKVLEQTLPKDKQHDPFSSRYLRRFLRSNCCPGTAFFRFRQYAQIQWGNRHYKVLRGQLTGQGNGQ
jgi:hypothetical protein